MFVPEEEEQYEDGAVLARELISITLNDVYGTVDFNVRTPDGELCGLNDPVGTGYVLEMLDESGDVIDSVTFVVMGDADGDSLFTNKDIIAMQRALVGFDEFTEYQEMVMDVFDDGKFNNRDMSFALRLMLGKDVFVQGEPAY